VAGLPKAKIDETLMDVRLFLVRARPRTSIPAGHKIARNLTEESEVVAKVQILLGLDSNGKRDFSGSSHYFRQRRKQ
jgi:hypothetical protein